ncbi:bifunctional aminoglycoside phosphotransferase/ATP-binding protein [Bradyrhizobium sp.]|uniref:bifunctional aminoglycoside phosphotransferase/ATP-binding protein n=1 Tax=Bradyrhizobium sp. TaxID=376 RepID=UPI001D62110D|nr:bifunctional aminoglycoside phosphotransferase/ATP-binding protein [Bradyrhizobium sp.]MBI5318413.1 AAA family ATPase [Bradyrhizobium sp.]
MTAPAKSTASSQNEVLAFLAAGAGTGVPTRRIDTHISIVFLAADRVLKIKRAVRLPFLDNSTLEQRKRCCEEELAVNARHAPAIYRRVVAITREADGLALGGKGPPVEWAVEMARFDETRTLDHLAAARAVPPAAADLLAETMRASHAGAPIATGSQWPASIATIIDRNTDKFLEQRALPAGDVGRLHELSHRHFRDHLALLQRRTAAGQVRRCHGDAHLANIVMIGEQPVLFDAIEFDAAMATTDLLYDLAFPIMDFLHFGYADAANRLFNGYLQSGWREHGDALVLLPLFLSMRAAVRALVSFTKHELCPDDPAGIADAKSYFALALHLIAPRRPSLLAIGGRSGTGKSVLARSIAGRIAPAPGAVLLRSDLIRKELAGVDALTRLPEAAYTRESSDRVYGEMFDRARHVLAQGHSALLDAAFLTEAERTAAAEIARAAGIDFHGIFLVAAPEVRVQRIGSRRNDASDASQAVALSQEAIDPGAIDWPIVDASGTPDETLAHAAPHLPPSQRCNTY